MISVIGLDIKKSLGRMQDIAISPKIIEWFTKKANGSQVSGASDATGVPQLAGLGLPEVISPGIADR